MGHHISALVIRGQFDEAMLRNLRFTWLPLAGLHLFPLEPDHLDLLDRYVERRRLTVETGPVHEPICNAAAVHAIVRRAAGEARFAFIETDYFGGLGDQAAAVYEGASVLMEPKRSGFGPINEALKLMGIQRTVEQDEFAVFGLEGIRSNDAIGRLIERKQKQ